MTRPRPFPARVAAVDMGSNAIRFVAAEFRDRSRPRELDSERVPVRLGHHAYRTGALDAGLMDAAVEALAGFRRRMDALDVSAHRVVATSAVRESRNGGELIERARREAGLEIEAITGAEEARLVAVAALDRLGPDGRESRWLMVDLGGGSLEVSVVGPGGVAWSESHRVGTVRLLDEMEEEDEAEAGGADAREGESERVRRLVERHTDGIRVPSLDDDGLAGILATGGNIEALAELAGAAPDTRGVSRLPLAALRGTRARLASMSARERVTRLGLREDRADVILPAAHVYGLVAERAGAEEIVVPNAGVKEGILLDLVDTLLGDSTAGA